MYIYTIYYSDESGANLWLRCHIFHCSRMGRKMWQLKILKWLTHTELFPILEFLKELFFQQPEKEGPIMVIFFASKWNAELSG